MTKKILGLAEFCVSYLLENGKHGLMRLVSREGRLMFLDKVNDKLSDLVCLPDLKDAMFPTALTVKNVHKDWDGCIAMTSVGNFYFWFERGQIRFENKVLWTKESAYVCSSTGLVVKTADLVKAIDAKRAETAPKFYEVRDLIQHVEVRQIEGAERKRWAVVIELSGAFGKVVLNGFPSKEKEKELFIEKNDQVERISPAKEGGLMLKLAGGKNVYIHLDEGNLSEWGKMSDSAYEARQEERDAVWAERHNVPEKSVHNDKHRSSREKHKARFEAAVQASGGDETAARKLLKKKGGEKQKKNGGKEKKTANNKK